MMKIEILFGHVEIKNRLRKDGDRIIGESRLLQYDRDGLLTKDTGWQPTGAVATVGWWPEYAPRRWWEFWK